MKAVLWFWFAAAVSGSRGGICTGKKEDAEVQSQEGTRWPASRRSAASSCLCSVRLLQMRREEES